MAEPGLASPRTRSREIIKKICVLGDASSGKTLLIKRYVYSMFDDAYITTIGTKVTKKSMNIDRDAHGRRWDVRITLLVWDILGQKQYSRLHPVYYQGAEGAFIVCDGRRPECVAGLREWALTFQEVAGPVPLLFLINGAPGPSDAPQDGAAIAALCAEFGAPFMLVDDSTGLNVDAAFEAMSGRLVDRYIASGGSLADEPGAPPVRPWAPVLSLLRRLRRRPKHHAADARARAELARIARAIGAPEPSL